MRNDFTKELREYEARFEAMEPEEQIILKDKFVNSEKYETTVEGYIVVWNTGIAKDGPLPFCAKGGTRIHPKVTLDEVKMLARKMALKNAAAGLPLGGAKSGLRGNPDEKEFKQKYQKFVEIAKPHFHENGGKCGGLGFDIGARPEHVDWAIEVLGSGKSFTGKPAKLGGTDYDKNGIAGLGVAVAARTYLDAVGKSAKGAQFAVQGLGAMGAAVTKYFAAYGGQMVALGDPVLEGTWIFKSPPTKAFYEYVGERDYKKIRTYLDINANHIGKDSNVVLEQTCDVLFPCAMQNVITNTNVAKLKTKLICEGANEPVALDTYKRLQSRCIPVIPDFIANPGGVIAAFVEMTSKSKDKVTEAKEMTEMRIAENVRACLKLAEEHGVSLREAGLYLAYQRILD